MSHDRRVRQRLAMFGLVGGPLIIPEIIWEFGADVYATVWAFEASSPLLRGRAVTA